MGGAHSDYFEPYWIATSEFSPDQFGFNRLLLKTTFYPMWSPTI
jgi:hypothetical protein